MPKTLIKVDLNYFFDTITKEYAASVEAKIRKANKNISSEELSEKIKENTETTLQELKKVEEPVVEKTMQKQGEGQ